MRKSVGITLLSVVGMMLLSGCATPPPSPEFESNNKAVELLGGTTWGDPAAGVSISFDANAKITAFTVPDMPAELANFRIDGEPFTITVPSEGIPTEVAGFIAGKQLTASLENSKTVINDDGSMQIVFTGDVDIPLVTGITFTVNTSAVQSGQEFSLNGLTGSLVVHTGLMGDFNVFSGSLADNIPITQLN